MKAAFVGLAFAGSVTLWLAVLADMGTSLLVTANGLRLLRGARRQRPAVPHAPTPEPAVGVQHAHDGGAPAHGGHATACPCGHDHPAAG